MQREGRSKLAGAELKNRIRAHAHVQLGHGSKDTAHGRVDTSNYLSQLRLIEKLKHGTTVLWAHLK